jgi:hypothetical protein
MDYRRLSAITLLKRLKKYELEKASRELGALRHRMVQLEQQRQLLADGLSFKSPENNINFIPYMQQYVPAAKAEIGFIADKMAQLESKITTIENGVSDKFQAYKTLDIIHVSLSADMRYKQEVRENAEIEETVLWRWMQKQRTKLQKNRILHEIQKG